MSLRRNMSLVGPRPALPSEVDAAWHCQRFAAQPAITGSRQVRAHNRRSVDDPVPADIDHLWRRPLWLDLELRVHTPRAALTTRGIG